MPESESINKNVERSNPEVTALIERASRFTSDEIGCLAAVKDVGNVAWHAWYFAKAAWRDAGGAWWYDAKDAWCVADNAAGNAINGHTWDSIRFVLRCAAAALVVKDLVGQHGFTRAHYDALTRPVCEALPDITHLFDIEDQVETAR